jgi:pyruvate/2-oxoglutarate/acetoin dehydrogenase E1 component
MNYKEQMTRAMSLLSTNGYVFVGQSVKFPGTAMYSTLVNVPESQRLELPVAENFQLGLSCGMSFHGINVCSLFPRMDFLLSAYDQLINHLDKIELLSEGRLKPKVIIRTSVGGVKNLNPGLQHVGNYIESLRIMLKTIPVISLKTPESIYPAYEFALKSERSSILVEFGDAYND